MTQRRLDGSHYSSSDEELSPEIVKNIPKLMTFTELSKTPGRLRTQDNNTTKII